MYIYIYIYNAVKHVICNTMGTIPAKRNKFIWPELW